MNAPTRVFCHAEHYCHHWFEDECSDACDRGEHNYPHGHEGCDRPSTTDPRLTHDRIRAARRVEWDDPKQWDGDVPRPGFVERLAPYDPNPEYSRLDALNGLVDDTLNPPARPVRADSLRDIGERVTPVQHSMYRPLLVFGMILSGFVIAGAFVALGVILTRWPA